MTARTLKGAVVRGFYKASGDIAAAVELEDGRLIYADTFTRLEPGAAVTAAFDVASREWTVKIAREAAA